MLDQRRLPADLRITFTPLTQNRLRCNWNGAVISQRQRKAAFNRRWGELHPRSTGTPGNDTNLLSGKIFRVESATIGRNGDQVPCPYCAVRIWASRSQPINPGKMSCTSCHREFNAVLAPPLPKSAWTPPYIGSRYGNSTCPHCELPNSSHPAGETRCKYCSRDYLAVETEIREDELPEATITGNYVQCPHGLCRRLNYSEDGLTFRPGVTTCRVCQNQFKAIAPVRRAALSLR